MAHLCGLCLTLRDLHGQNARLVTNYDGLLVSVLTEAQNPVVAPHRQAGPCALRGLRRADVLDSAGEGARLAASVSLVLAAGKVRDHVTDGDGAYARRFVASGAEAVATRWQSAGERTGARIGFDTSVLTDAIGRQAEIEHSAGLSLLDVTEPTETAVGAAFAHTAELARRPDNAEALAAAGRNFGRLAHLLDAVEDLPADEAAGLYNPLLATGTTPDSAREHCEEALSRLRTAIVQLELDERTLTESLLMREVGVAVDQVFADAARRASTGRAASTLRAGTFAAGTLPCLQGVRCVQETPDSGPRTKRRKRCRDCCDCSDCPCDACCEICNAF
jgi:hypothetical protein